MVKLAVLILTYNEERNIADCIKSAAFADEIVVIDSGSTDGTVDLARSLGARVVIRPMPDGFAAQRNFALTQTDAEWVMFLDADERITPELAAEIRNVVGKNEPYAFEILRRNYLFGQPMKYGVFRPDYSLRLYPRSAVCWSSLVHEEARVALQKRRLKNAMLHYTYDDWDRYFVKFNIYTSLMARKMSEQGKRSGMLQIIIRPWLAFFRAYVLRSGWRDGKLGFILSVFHFFYTMVKYVKLYWLQKQKGQ